MARHAPMTDGSRTAPPSSRDRPGTCCLRFIDSCGDTVCNEARLPVLLEALRALRNSHQNGDQAPFMTRWRV